MNHPICKKQRFRGPLDNYPMTRVTDNFGTLQVIRTITVTFLELVKVQCTRFSRL